MPFGKRHGMLVLRCVLSMSETTLLQEAAPGGDFPGTVHGANMYQWAAAARAMLRAPTIPAVDTAACSALIEACVVQDVHLPRFAFEPDSSTSPDFFGMPLWDTPSFQGKTPYNP